jgi:hypothetical protein
LLATDQPEERQPTRVNILRRLSNLAAVVPKDGLLLVSFAGHGLERDRRAYLLPTDAQYSDDISLVEQTAVGVNQMKDSIRAIGVQQVIVLLDACRNDPVGRGVGGNPMSAAYKFDFDLRNREVTAFATLYATAVGQLAYEYSEKRQGYFTWAIVEGLKGAAGNAQGEVTLAALLKHVQEAVPKRVGIDLGAGKEQKPFAEIVGYLAGGLVIAYVPKVAQPVNMSSPISPVNTELQDWKKVRDSNDPEQLREFLKKYPNGDFADAAKGRLDTLSALIVEKETTPSPAITATSKQAAPRASRTRTFTTFTIQNQTFGHVQIFLDDDETPILLKTSYVDQFEVGSTHTVRAVVRGRSFQIRFTVPTVMRRLRVTYEGISF